MGERTRRGRRTERRHTEEVSGREGNRTQRRDGSRTHGKSENEILLVFRVLVDTKVLLDEALDALGAEIEAAMRDEGEMISSSSEHVSLRPVPVIRASMSEMSKLTAWIHPPASAPQ